VVFGFLTYWTFCAPMARYTHSNSVTNALVREPRIHAFTFPRPICAKLKLWIRTFLAACRIPGWLSMTPTKILRT